MVQCDPLARKPEDPAPERRTLEDLPSELLAIIATNLRHVKLRLIREIDGRRIDECIDRIFISRSSFNQGEELLTYTSKLTQTSIIASRGLRGILDGLLSAWTPRDNATIPGLKFHRGIGSPRHTHNIAVAHICLDLFRILREMKQGKLRLDEFPIFDDSNQGGSLFWR